MFIPAEMSEVEIFVYENDVHNVAQTVAQMGVMHLLDVNTLGKWAEGVGTEWPRRVSAYANQERRVREMLASSVSKSSTICEGRKPVGGYLEIEKSCKIGPGAQSASARPICGANASTGISSRAPWRLWRLFR